MGLRQCVRRTARHDGTGLARLGGSRGAKPRSYVSDDLLQFSAVDGGVHEPAAGPVAVRVEAAAAARDYGALAASGGQAGEATLPRRACELVDERSPEPEKRGDRVRQPTDPLKPKCGNPGSPGNVAPATSKSGHDTRHCQYTFGVSSARCESLQITAPPWAVRRPLTAHAFDPGSTSARNPRCPATSPSA